MHARIPIGAIDRPPTSSLRQLLSSVRITGSAVASTAFQANFPLEYGPRQLSRASNLTAVIPTSLRARMRTRTNSCAHTHTTYAHKYLTDDFERGFHAPKVPGLSPSRAGRLSLSRCREYSRGRSLVINLAEEETPRASTIPDSPGIEIRSCMFHGEGRAQKEKQRKMRGARVYTVNTRDAPIISSRGQIGACFTRGL